MNAHRPKSTTMPRQTNAEWVLPVDCFEFVFITTPPYSAVVAPDREIDPVLETINVSRKNSMTISGGFALRGQACARQAVHDSGTISLKSKGIVQVIEQPVLSSKTD